MVVRLIEKARASRVNLDIGNVYTLGEEGVGKRRWMDGNIENDRSGGGGGGGDGGGSCSGRISLPIYRHIGGNGVSELAAS